MKRFILLLICLNPFFILSQKQNDSIIYYLQEGNLEKVSRLIIKEKDVYKLINIGTSLANESKYEASNMFLIQALKADKNVLDDDLKNDIYNTIAISFEELNEFDLSKKYYNLGINSTNNISNSNKNSYLFLSDLEFRLGQNLEAINTINIFLSKVNSILGKKNSYYIDGLKSLCYFHLINNISKGIEKDFDSLLLIVKDFYGENNSEYLNALSFKINLLIKQNKFKEAEIASLFLINQFMKYAKDDYKNLSLAYNQLAKIQQELYKFDLAEENLIKALEIIRNNYGENDILYTLHLLNIGNLYLEKNDYDNAEKYFLNALYIKQKINDNETFAIYHELAATYFKKNNCELAEKYQLKFKEFIKNKYNEEYKKNLIGLIVISNCLKNNINEFNYLYELAEINTDDIIRFIDFMPFNELSFIIDKYLYLNSYNYSFLEKQPYQFTKLNEISFEQELLLKNLILSDYLKLKKNILKSPNKLIKDKFTRYLELKNYVNQVIHNNLNDHNLNNIQIEISEIEKYLKETTLSFSKHKKKLQTKFINFKNYLKKDELIINFIDYNKFEGKKFIGFKYGVFIIKSNSKFPKFIPLFEEKQLTALLEQNKSQEVSSIIDKLYLNKQISELILKPLENELKGISTIYLSLSGLTHQINVAALSINENQTFGQKYKIHILNSPSELMDYTSITFDKKDKLDFILYGNIDYDKRNIISNEDNVDNQDIVNVDEEIKGLQTRSGISNFGYLSGTKNEIQNISTLAHKGDFKAFIFEDRKATEESIKQLDGRTSPFVLHLATHGFFFPDPVIEMSNEFLIEGKSKVFKTSDDPMMRSGLVFSGANKSWGKVNENLLGDDGILTASEISNLDLSACQLVVISACETGLGEVKGSEGVFGLQRAFKMAGVKNIIMSLWKVPDAQTAELFDTFYSECFAGKTIHEAFQLAQAKMKAKYSPYNWAGFVLLE